jgi:ABC-type polysaccharide/polyol phosphate transport system ATPase subunit
VICAHRISKRYRLYEKPSDRIWELFPFSGPKQPREFWALRDVSFGVEKGEFLGIVGPNGSGKSTLLQILSGTISPTAGRIVAQGRIAALLELGVGFHPESTGRENVYINGEILGLSRNEIRRAMPAIEAFAEIGEYMDRPVKEYSSGMYVRLAFAAAVHSEPDILIVDEALAVGDAAFSHRCVQRFEEMKRRGVTVLFVSHDLGLVKQLSDRALFMLGGRVAAEGRPNEVVNRYVGYVLERQKGEEAQGGERNGLTAGHRHGDGLSRVRRVELRDSRGVPRSVFESGERMSVVVEVRFAGHAAEPVVGMLVRNRHGIDVFGTNTRLEGRKLGRFEAGDELEVEFRFDCLFTEQEYTLTVASQHWDGSSQDWLDDVATFRVISPRRQAGFVHLRTEVECRKRSGAA